MQGPATAFFAAIPPVRPRRTAYLDAGNKRRKLYGSSCYRPDRAVLSVCGDFTDELVIDLVAQVRRLADECFYDLIEVEITSDGGAVQALRYFIEALDAFRRDGVSVTTRALARAGSAAAVMLSMGDRREAAFGLKPAAEIGRFLDASALGPSSGIIRSYGLIASWVIFMPLTLPPHLQDAFDEAAPLLATGVPKHRLVLSGGSVLQALWSHRTSTDLDFFVPATAEDADQRMRRNRMRNIAVAVRNRGHALEDLDSECVTGWVANVHFSLVIVNWLQLDPGRDTVQSSVVQVADVEEVFTGKIHGRFKTGRKKDGRIPIRDLYDLTVCMREYPSVLHRLFAGIREQDAQAYAKRLRDMPPNWHELDEDGVIDPAYEVDLHGLPQKVAQAVGMMDASLLPVAQRPPTWDGKDGDGAMGGGP